MHLINSEALSDIKTDILAMVHSSKSKSKIDSKKKLLKRPTKDEAPTIAEESPSKR
jgi:hypothetical protein